MNKLERDLLSQITDLHSVPQGSYNIRKNGESIKRVSNDEIKIVSKTDKSGIDVVIRDDVKNKSVHIPVIVTKSGFDDLTYNDFYIGDNCDVLIVAGCGIHNNGNKKSSHDGIHRFFVGKNSKVRYVEKHLAIGKDNIEKNLNPKTSIILKDGSQFEMETVQLEGVSYSNRETSAKLFGNSKLIIKEKILTTNNQIANTKFKVELIGDNSSVEVVSRSVAKDFSKQKFVSNIIGKSSCYGRVECDGIMVGNAQIVSIPQVQAKNINASLSHEASLGKIAGEQLIKLLSLGLNQQEAEDVILKGYLK